jgi:hypothetical protein
MYQIDIMMAVIAFSLGDRIVVIGDTDLADIPGPTVENRTVGTWLAPRRPHLRLNRKPNHAL